MGIEQEKIMDVMQFMPPGQCDAAPEGFLNLGTARGSVPRHCYWGNPDLVPADFALPPKPPVVEEPVKQQIPEGPEPRPPAPMSYALAEGPTSQRYEATH